MHGCSINDPNYEKLTSMMPSVNVLSMKLGPISMCPPPHVNTMQCMRGIRSRRYNLPKPKLSAYSIW